MDYERSRPILRELQKFLLSNLIPSLNCVASGTYASGQIGPAGDWIILLLPARLKTFVIYQPKKLKSSAGNFFIERELCRCGLRFHEQRSIIADYTAHLPGPQSGVPLLLFIPMFCVGKCLALRQTQGKSS
jgi:hypothetical protein